MDWTVRRPHVADINTQQMVAELVAAGWTRRSGLAGVVDRLYWPGERPVRGRFITIPHDATFEDYELLLEAALAELADAAGTGQAADRVLTTLATAQAAKPDTASDLDDAMHTCWLDGNWKWMTGKMSMPAREAAVAAVLRYDRSVEKDPADWLDRSTLAWWEH